MGSDAVPIGYALTGQGRAGTSGLGPEARTWGEISDAAGGRRLPPYPGPGGAAAPELTRTDEHAGQTHEISRPNTALRRGVSLYRNRRFLGKASSSKFMS